MSSTLTERYTISFLSPLQVLSNNVVSLNVVKISNVIKNSVLISHPPRIQQLCLTFSEEYVCPSFHGKQQPVNFYTGVVWRGWIAGSLETVKRYHLPSLGTLPSGSRQTLVINTWSSSIFWKDSQSVIPIPFTFQEFSPYLQSTALQLFLEHNNYKLGGHYQDSGFIKEQICCFPIPEIHFLLSSWKS